MREDLQVSHANESAMPNAMQNKTVGDAFSAIAKVGQNPPTDPKKRQEATNLIYALHLQVFGDNRVYTISDIDSLPRDTVLSSKAQKLLRSLCRLKV